MKKILLSISLAFLCLCLVGCSNTQEDLAVKLDSHLNRLNSVITTVQDINEKDITYNFTKTETQGVSNRLTNPVVNKGESNKDTMLINTEVKPHIYSDVLKTNDSLNSYKCQICELIDMLKALSNQVKKSQIKLNKNQINGVNELLSNLSINTNRISMTKNETNTEVARVRAMINDKSNNESALHSRFIRLNNCLETRLTYYKNCINVLNQIRVLLACENGNCAYENGKVCVDGNCYEDSELSKYGEKTESNSSENENVLNNQNDIKLFEEFKNYLEKTKQENLVKNQEISQEQKELNEKPLETDQPLEVAEKKDENDENVIQNNDTVNQAITNDLQKNDIQPEINSQEKMPENSQQETRKKIIEENTPKTLEELDQNNQTNVIQHQSRKNIDTYKDPTVKKNIDSFRRAGNKIVSPNQIVIAWTKCNKPFPEKIAETNIASKTSIEPDKQFVDSSKVENIA